MVTEPPPPMDVVQVKCLDCKVLLSVGGITIDCHSSYQFQAGVISPPSIIALQFPSALRDPFQ